MDTTMHQSNLFIIRDLLASALEHIEEGDHEAAYRVLQDLSLRLEDDYPGSSDPYNYAAVMGGLGVTEISDETDFEDFNLDDHQ